jgi:hypothetical protein
MLCFDCATSCGSPGLGDSCAQVDAVAICCRCGAGLCQRHVVEREVHLMVTAVINREVAVEPPARRLAVRTVCPNWRNASVARLVTHGWARTETRRAHQLVAA